MVFLIFSGVSDREYNFDTALSPSTYTTASWAHVHWPQWLEIYILLNYIRLLGFHNDIHDNGQQTVRKVWNLLLEVTLLTITVPKGFGLCMMHSFDEGERDI